MPRLTSVLIALVMLSSSPRLYAEALAKCLNSRELKAINNNYRDLLVCERNYADMKLLYDQCISKECEQTPFWRREAVMIPSYIIIFAIGFATAKGMD